MISEFLNTVRALLFEKLEHQIFLQILCYSSPTKTKRLSVIALREYSPISGSDYTYLWLAIYLHSNNNYSPQYIS